MSPVSRPAKAARVLLIVAVSWPSFSAFARASPSRQPRISVIRKTSPTTEPRRLEGYDIKGRLITEFFSDEKREIVSIKDLPRLLIDALITREDQSFYRHHGFTFRGILRAAWGVLTHTSRGGGSTITQQLAGTLSISAAISASSARSSSFGAPCSWNAAILKKRSSRCT